MKVYRKNDVDITFSNNFMDLEQLSYFEAVSLEEVKKAREEIKNLSIEVITDYESYEMVETTDVLEILDKLIAESEGIMEVEEALFEKYVKEELRLTELDPLDYIYYRESAGFEAYMIRFLLREILNDLMEPFKPFLDWLSEKLGGKK